MQLLVELLHALFKMLHSCEEGILRGDDRILRGILRGILLGFRCGNDRILGEDHSILLLCGESLKPRICSAKQVFQQSIALAKCTDFPQMDLTV